MGVAEDARGGGTHGGVDAGDALGAEPIDGFHQRDVLGQDRPSQGIDRGADAACADQALPGRGKVAVGRLRWIFAEAAGGTRRGEMGA